MEEDNSWRNIEGAIKNLSAALQSFPDELKAKALKLLGTQLNTSEEQPWLSGNEENLALKLENEERNESLINLYTSLTAVTANDTVTAEPSTLVPTETRRRGRQSRVKTDKTSSQLVSSGLKKSLRSGKLRKNSCEEDEEEKEEEEKPVKKMTRQNAKESKMDHKIISSSETSKKSAKADLSKKVDKSLEIDAGQDIDQNASLDGQELPAESATDIFISALKTRKRGRPRKSDITMTDIKTEELLLSDVGSSEAKEVVSHKKPGRPRQSSYSSGYIPKAKSFGCSVCGKMLATKQSYREHQRQHTGEGFICDNCGQRFTTSSGFMLHKRYHTDDPHMYKCSKCKYIVSSQQLLDDHYQLRHNPDRPKSHICDVCGKAFHGSTQLEKHLFSHSNTKPYACDQCSFSTAYPGGLEKHKYNVHVVDRLLFRCELCGIQLKSKGTYVEHIGRHFNQRKKKCEVCEKTFPNASQLAAHRRCHLEPTVPCTVCGKKLRSKHKLKVHELIHTGQKDFACPYCTYVTYVKHNLKKHCQNRHKVDYPPLLTQKMKKFKLSEVSSDGLKDPLALRCLRKLSNTMVQSTEDQDCSNTAPAAAAAAADAAAVNIEESVVDKPQITDSKQEQTKLDLVPTTKVETIVTTEMKPYVCEDKMYVTLSTIDRSAILDFNCPPGTFYQTNLYLPTLVNGDQQLT